MRAAIELIIAVSLAAMLGGTWFWIMGRIRRVDVPLQHDHLFEGSGYGDGYIETCRYCGCQRQHGKQIRGPQCSEARARTHQEDDEAYCQGRRRREYKWMRMR